MLSVGIKTKITILFLVLGISLRKLTSYLLSLHNCVPQQAVLQISPNQKIKKPQHNPQQKKKKKKKLGNYQN